MICTLIKRYSLTLSTCMCISSEKEIFMLTVPQKQDMQYLLCIQASHCKQQLGWMKNFCGIFLLNETWVYVWSVPIVVNTASIFSLNQANSQIIWFLSTLYFKPLNTGNFKAPISFPAEWVIILCGYFTVNDAFHINNFNHYRILIDAALNLQAFFTFLALADCGWENLFDSLRKLFEAIECRHIDSEQILYEGGGGRQGEPINTGNQISGMDHPACQTKAAACEQVFYVNTCSM